MYQIVLQFVDVPVNSLFNSYKILFIAVVTELICSVIIYLLVRKQNKNHNPKKKSITCFNKIKSRHSFIKVN